MSGPREAARPRALWLAVVVLALVAAWLPDVAGADVQGPDPAPWVIQGDVRSIVPSGSHTFLGGVDYVGPYTGEGAALSASGDGAPLTGFATVEQAQGSLVDRSRVVGELQAALPDGAGGWYVAGGFGRVGREEREGLAHLLPDGSLDPNFRVDVGGVVWALARHVKPGCQFGPVDKSVADSSRSP